MPISTGAIMDRFGMPYNITSILSATDIGHLDEAAYHAYSPVYISVTFAMTWTLAFALSTAAITHTVLYHGGEIWRAMRRRQVEEPDIHAKLMRSYPKVPFWYVRSCVSAPGILMLRDRWFACLSVLGFVLSIIAIEVRTWWKPSNDAHFVGPGVPHRLSRLYAAGIALDPRRLLFSVWISAGNRDAIGARHLSFAYFCLYLVINRSWLSTSCHNFCLDIWSLATRSSIWQVFQSRRRIL